MNRLISNVVRCTRLVVIERPLVRQAGACCASLEVKIGHCAHRFNDVDDGGKTDGAGRVDDAFLNFDLGNLVSFGPKARLSKGARVPIGARIFRK